MNWGITLLLAFAFGLLFFIYQRSERRRRLFILFCILVVGEMLRRYVFFRSEPPFTLPYFGIGDRLVADLIGVPSIHEEAWAGLTIAVVFNVLFWLFIGRYNPVGSSDSIQVIGMDD